MARTTTRPRRSTAAMEAIERHVRMHAAHVARDELIGAAAEVQAALDEIDPASAAAELVQRALDCIDARIAALGAR